jgi:hypothetical protein
MRSPDVDYILFEFRSPLLELAQGPGDSLLGPLMWHVIVWCHFQTCFQYVYECNTAQLLCYASPTNVKGELIIRKIINIGIDISLRILFQGNIVILDDKLKS